jgi:uncharacterized RDD family membrane protein YckC
LNEYQSNAAAVEPSEPSRNRRPVPQRLAFHDCPQSNIIPFESFAAHRIQPLAAMSTAKAAPAAGDSDQLPRPSTPIPQHRRGAAAPFDEDRQPGLGFLVPPPQGPRTLETQAEAVIYCDAIVASPKHRAIAAAVDGGMIFIGFAAFLFTFHLMGGMFHLNRQTIPFLIGVFGAVALFYGLLWIWSGRETLGMRWTKLRLIDFDGFPANRQDRVLRSFGLCLSFCAGGLGLLWGLVDEEQLTWHDHMSKTFPTLQESNSPFFHKR